MNKGETMKSALVLAAIVLGSTWAQAATCFKAQQAVPKVLPQTICLRSLEVNETAATAVIETDKAAAQTKILKVTKFSRHNEERTRFVSELELLKHWETGCYVGESATLTLNGEANSAYSPSIDPSLMSVKIYFKPTTDTCHNPVYDATYEYARIR